MSTAPDTPCNGCGKLMWSGRGSAPPERRWCHPCRRAGKRPRVHTYVRNLQRHALTCQQCTVVFYREDAVAKFCGLVCYQASRRVHVSGKARRRGIDRTRRARRRAGGGLTEAQFRALLRRWKRQGRLCTYCLALAASVDHVVPLARGGSNREGNLTPACLRCNHAKRDQFITEWRYADARAAA